MIRGSDELINYLKDEVPRKVNKALGSGDIGSTLLQLSNLCIEMMARVCPALSNGCVGNELTDAWRSMASFIGFTREFVMVKYFAIALGSRELLKMGGDALLLDVLARDLITCIEKFRVMTLKMLEVGMPWTEIISGNG